MAHECETERDNSNSNPNPLLHTDQLLHLRDTSKKLVIAMVGLPARGKTYISRKVARWLNWIGYSSQVFNIGTYRREMFGASRDSSFFDPNNHNFVKMREECAVRALDDALEFFKKGGHVAIYDGTNSTKKRREMVVDYLRKKHEEGVGLQIELVWVESICEDESIIESNIKETKLSSPDYQNQSSEQALSDFRARIDLYALAYESLPMKSDTPFIKIIDAGRQVITNRISGYLMGKLTFYLMNLRINHAPIYISRHGESQHNLKGLIGGDSNLTERGKTYARELAKFIHSQEDLKDKNDPSKMIVQCWSSTLKRTIETASYLNLPFTQWRALVEIQVGTCDNMTYEEIEKTFPAEFESRKKNKLNYRYPQGESYMDVVHRLEPVIFEMERIAVPVLVVCHRAVARCLFSYFLDLPPEKIPHIDIPLHTVIKLEPKAYGCQVTHFPLQVPSIEDAGPHVQTSS